MQPLLTPGAQRAFAEAANWLPEADVAALEAAVGPSTELVLSPIGLAELLIGLLSEPDCRAARMLADIGVETVMVLDRWPDLVSLPAEDFLPLSGRRWSDEVQMAVAAAMECLADYPKPLELATEHLLLGIAATQTEVATWLRQRGLHRDQLELRNPSALWPHARAAGGRLVGNVGQRRGQTVGRTKHAARSHGDPTEAMHNRVGIRRRRSEIGTLRIIDAAANRAGEGLRVVEDFVRFALDDRASHQPRQTNAARSHGRALAAFRRPIAWPLATPRPTSAPAYPRRPKASARMLRRSSAPPSSDCSKRSAAWRNSQSSLIPPSRPNWNRCAIGPTHWSAPSFTTGDSLARLADAKLYVLLDGGDSLDELGRLAEILVGAGVDVLQFRDKRLPDRQLLRSARRLREITVRSATLLIINDRPDLAALVRADGVHVGQEELCVKDVRQIVGPRMLVGVSTHTMEQARQAVIDGANYIGVGPMFPSGTKAFPALAGLNFAREVAAEIRLPAFAIGGIGPDNVAEILASGIRRVAIGGAIIAAGDPAAAVRQILERFVSDATPLA